MPKGLNGVAPSMGGAGAPFVALEVSALSRAVGIGGPELNRAGTHRLAPAGTGGLPERIGQARSGAGGPSRALPACEAGCEGFRPARRLSGRAPETYVAVRGPASLGAVRGKRRAKTDRTGARRTVRAPPSRDGGGRDAMPPVRIPTVGEEGAKRLPPGRERLAGSGCGARTRSPGCPGCRESGETGVSRAPRRAWDRLRQGAAAGASGGDPRHPRPAGTGLRGTEGGRGGEGRGAEGVGGGARQPSGAGRRDRGNGACSEGGADGHPGRNGGTAGDRGADDALPPGSELFCRDFRSRRQLASLAGLAPVPFAGGGIDRDRGTGRAGSPMPPTHPVRMAWRWLLRQPGSALPKRYRDCASARDGRSRKRGIVALARRLLAALWRCATAGPAPEGAVLPRA